MPVKPILFNTEMVRAILDGRKTVTRRVIKPQPHIAGTKTKHPYFSWKGNGYYNLCEESPYQPGDILYVRETWSQTRCSDCDFEYDECELNIERDGKCPPDEGFCDDEYYVYRATDKVNSISNGQIKWRPSIHMPKEAARIWLKVTDVRVERLQDISPEECVREGAEPEALQEVGGEFVQGMFHDIWDSTIKKKDLSLYGWDANPWVWVIEFERTVKPDGN